MDSKLYVKRNGEKGSYFFLGNMQGSLVGGGVADTKCRMILRSQRRS